MLGIDPIATKAGILAMCGGMGSLNDVVLHKDGQWQGLVKKNDGFNDLRSQLYELCYNNQFAETAPEITGLLPDEQK